MSNVPVTEDDRTYDLYHASPWAANHLAVYGVQDVFSETKNTVLEGLRTPLSKIWEVLNARTEEMGLNATARVFHTGKQTMNNWERRFGQLQEVLLIYALMQQFVERVIEGDEAYTKIHKNVPPHESSDWTIALLDRASRFLWELECGEREESLFRHAVERLESVIRQTGNLSLFTDGERRYGNLLFEIYSEVVKTGRPGRPKTTLKSGVRALRRKCSAFRRRTNTYAKSQDGLQRLLRVYWVMHNSVGTHFTTKEVPAVTLGVLERPLSVQEMMRIQYR